MPTGDAPVKGGSHQVAEEIEETGICQGSINLGEGRDPVQSFVHLDRHGQQVGTGGR